MAKRGMIYLIYRPLLLFLFAAIFGMVSKAFNIPFSGFICLAMCMASAVWLVLTMYKTQSKVEEFKDSLLSKTQEYLQANGLGYLRCSKVTTDRDNDKYEGKRMGGPIEIEGVLENVPFKLAFAEIWDMVSSGSDNIRHRRFLWTGYKISWGTGYPYNEYIKVDFVDDYSPEKTIQIIKEYIHKYER